MLYSTSSPNQASNASTVDSGRYPIPNSSFENYAMRGTSTSASTGVGGFSSELTLATPSQMCGMGNGSVDPTQLLATLVQGIMQLLSTLLGALGLGSAGDLVGGESMPYPGMPSDAQTVNTRGVPLDAQASGAANMPPNMQATAPRQSPQSQGESKQSEGSFLQKVPEYIEKGKELWESGKEAYNQASEYISDAWDTAGDWANTAWDTATDWGGAVWDGAKSAYSTGASWLSSLWSYFV